MCSENIDFRKLYAPIRKEAAPLYYKIVIGHEDLELRPVIVSPCLHFGILLRA